MLPLTPTKLGRYEIADEIGKGAMGVVYLARDPLIGRLVALKTFRIGYSVRDSEMEQFRIRFMREAQSAGILTHPNIVTIHDVVEQSEEGLAFIAMEYVRGTNLKLLLQSDQALPLSFVLETIAQVGDALDYAHSNGVVHRDVKPANILITTDNKVKITDFGIARLDSSNLTQEGQLLGTPNYMAPEQIQGKEVDHRADLFSLGVVLYEMLTRHKPFQGENLTVVSHRIVYDHFTPAQEYVRNLPPGLEPILSRALDKDPARRYQRAREMVDDLRQLVEANRQADDLNETQSLSATLVLPPLPSPPPVPGRAPAAAKPSLFSRWRKEPARASQPALRPPVPLAPAAPAPAAPAAPARPAPPVPSEVTAVDDTSAFAALPPLPPPPDLSDTNATAEVPVLAAPAPTAVRRSSPSRLLLVTGFIVVLCILAGAGVLLSRRWSQPKVERTGVAPARQVPAQPVAAPPPVPVEATPAAAQPATLEGVVAQRLDIARQTFAEKRYDAAIAAAGATLMVDPGNAEAKKILTRAQVFQNRARQRMAQTPREPRPSETVAAAPPVISSTPMTRSPGEPASPATATTATLQVHFVSDFSGGGVLIVYVNDHEKMREAFSGWGGFFHLRQQEKRPEFNHNIEIPAGTADIRIHVAPTNRAALVKKIFGNFTGGTLHTLEVKISSAGQVDSNLH